MRENVEGPAFAVLFKTYFWDDFAERQFQRLCARAGGGDVFIVADDSHGRVDIPHGNVFRVTEELSEAEGYLRYMPGRMFWYCNDYMLYHFLDRHPHYDYILSCEYDCFMGVEAGAIVGAMAAEGLDFVGERILTPPDEWEWARTAEPYYPPEVEVVGRLVCLAAFSTPFIRRMQRARLAHALVAKAAPPTTEPFGVLWPTHEVIVGAEIARLSAAERPLSDFADVGAYDWSPPYLETELANLPAQAVVHPVADRSRFLLKMTSNGWKLEDLFVKGSALEAHFSRCDPLQFMDLLLRRYLAEDAPHMVEHLRAYAAERLGEAARPLFNIARGRPATQSSVCEHSRRPSPSLDAAGAVDGVLTGSYGFHTGLDAEPWWCVDLEAVAPVRSIHIHNRADQLHRASRLVVSGSRDMARWDELYRHDPLAAAPGADGAPLRLEFASPLPLRFVRIHLATTEYLHLNEVEVYV